MARPTTYQTAYCEKLIEHMEEGGSFAAFAGVLKVARKTLYNWLEAFPEFEQAKDVGESCSLLWWENLSRHAAKGLIKDFNATVWIFTMKNRFGWRDKQKDEEPAPFIQAAVPLSSEQLLELAKKVREKKK